MSDPANPIPPFHLESFGPEGSGCVEEPVAFDEKGCVLLPLRKRGGRPGPPRTAGEGAAGPEPEATMEELQDKVAVMEREAYEKGFAQGQRDGLALENRQMEEKSRQLDELLRSLGALKGAIYRDTEEEVVRLAAAIAGKVVRRELSTGKQIIGETIRAAMKFLVDPSQLRIRVSPEDLEEVERILPSLASAAKGGRVQILEDRAVQRGGCILQTGFGSVNATIDDQMALVEKEIERVLNPDEGTRP